MRTFQVRIGTGKPSDEFKGFDKCSGPESNIIENLRGLLGNVELHLHGEWWTLISPEKLRKILVNLECNPKFTATIAS